MNTYVTFIYMIQSNKFHCTESLRNACYTLEKNCSRHNGSFSFIYQPKLPIVSKWCMVYIYTMTMKRTNIYLTDTQTDKLRELAYTNHWTISQIIRYAIDAYIQERKGVDTMSCIECGKEIIGLHAKTLRGRYHVDCITKLADKLVEEQLLTVEARNGMIKEAIRNAEADAKIDDII